MPGSVTWRGGDTRVAWSDQTATPTNPTKVNSMPTGEQRYHPGQTRASSLGRGTALVALDGPLRVEYRDGSMDWLLDAAPRVSITLAEGEHHILPYNALVEIRPAGSTAVTGLITHAQPPAVHCGSLTGLVRWLRRRFTGDIPAQ
jgi:hypothetical protein